MLQVLPYPESVPSSFIRKMVMLLNKGSIHSTIQLNDDCSGSVGLREDLAKQCFETLLDFSMLRQADVAAAVIGGDHSGSAEGGGGGGEGGGTCSLTNRLAITSLLQRFKVGTTTVTLQ